MEYSGCQRICGQMMWLYGANLFSLSSNLSSNKITVSINDIKNSGMVKNFEMVRKIAVQIRSSTK